MPWGPASRDVLGAARRTVNSPRGGDLEGALAAGARRGADPAAPGATRRHPQAERPPRACSDTEDFRTVLGSSPPLATPERRALADTALLQYTSGTTGVPKGAELTHGNLVVNCELMRLWLGQTPDDRVFGVVPWFHITGMEVQLNMMAYVGSTFVALGRFDLDGALRAIQDYRCTLTTLIATINVAIVNSPTTRGDDLSSLRLCASGGAPVPAEIARRWEAITGHTLVEGYGLTETTAPTHCNPPHRPRYGTVGLPFPFTEVRVVSLEDGVTELPVGASGAIVVRGPMVMKGYWRRAAGTP